MSAQYREHLPCPPHIAQSKGELAGSSAHLLTGGWCSQAAGYQHTELSLSLHQTGPAHTGTIQPVTNVVLNTTTSTTTTTTTGYHHQPTNQHGMILEISHTHIVIYVYVDLQYIFSFMTNNFVIPSDLEASNLVVN